CRLLREDGDAPPAIALVERPAVPNGNVHRAKISGARVPIVDRVAFLRATGAFEINRVVPGLAARGQLGDDSGGLHTGDGAGFHEKPVEELFPVDRLCVELAREGDVDGENVLRVESFIDLQQACETAGKKTGDDQQRRAQSDFEADQAFAKAQAAPSFSDGVASGAQRFLWV